MAAVIGIMACQREPVVEEPMTTGKNISSFQPNVIRLDTLVFSNPVRTNGQVRFDLIGTPPQIKTGDVVFYPGTGELYGKVVSATTAGSRMILQLEKAGLDEIFKSIVVFDESSKSLVRSRTRLFPSRWKSDTLDLTGLFVYNDFWQSRALQVQFESGKLTASSTPDQFLLEGQGGGPWLDRLALSGKYSLSVAGKVIIKPSGAMETTDSIRLESVVYGPVLLDGFPVSYQVDTWMGFHILSEVDTLFSMQFSEKTTGKLSLKYDYWDNWKFNNTSSGKAAIVEFHGGPKLTSYIGEIFVNQTITTLFCGESGFKTGNRLTARFDSSVDIPNWAASQKISEQAAMTKAGIVFGSDMPDKVGLTESLLYIDSQTGILQNQKPVASFTISPKTGFTDTNFEFDASASSDLETLLANLKARWDFDADDHFDTEFSTVKSIFYKYPLPGTYQPILEVQDEGGLVARTSLTLEVSLSSSAPIAYFTVTPESGRVSDVFYFDGQGCYDAQDGTDQLKVRWDFDGDGIWETNWSTRKIEYHLFPVPGIYVAKLEVLDTQGLSGSTTRIITVTKANVKPTALFTVTPDRGTVETKFDFDASGSTDPEDAPADLRIRWDWNNDGTYDTDYSTNKTIQHTFAVAGTYTVVLEVLDLEGYGSTFSRDLIVKELNTPPIADFIINPSPGKVDQMITFDASLSTDKEDSLDKLEVRWDWNNDNIYETSFSTVKVITNVFNAAGTYIIRVQVRDSEGLTDTRTQLLKIE